MKNRLVLVVNRRSSGYALVEKKIIRYIDGLNLSEKQRQTYEIEPTNPLDNAKKMAQVPQGQLSLARQQARSGNVPAALATWRSMFNGNVPPS